MLMHCHQISHSLVLAPEGEKSLVAAIVVVIEMQQANARLSQLDWPSAVSATRF